VSLRLACDLDGVLADMESALVREAKKLFGAAEPATDQSQTPGEGDPPSADGSPDAPPASDLVPPPPGIRLTSRQQRQLWRHIATIDSFWESLDEIESGSVARLAKVCRERRWEVLFLTKRPESAGFTAQIQSQRWLEAHGFPLPSVFVLPGSRGRVAAALGLDVVVDDRPENCVDVALDSHARAVLVWRRDPHDLPDAARGEGIDVVSSFDEALSLLSRLGPGGPSGLVSRVMERLGLKAPRT
jgi:hypothetical protein